MKPCIIIPVYNHGETLAGTLEELSCHGQPPLEGGALGGQQVPGRAEVGPGTLVEGRGAAGPVVECGHVALAH